MKAVDRLVRDDARQPCRKACIGTELPSSERAQIRLLQHVLGFRVVPDDCPCDPIEPLIVTPNDQAQRGRTALLRNAHELRIDEAGQLQLQSGLLGHLN